jgi:hypothetical protein
MTRLGRKKESVADAPTVTPATGTLCLREAITGYARPYPAGRLGRPALIALHAEAKVNGAAITAKWTEQCIVLSRHICRFLFERLQ